MKNKFLPAKIHHLRTQLNFLPRTIRLIWAGAGKLTLVWAGLLMVEGLLPAATVYLTKLLVDNLVVTPHTAWSARQARERLLNEVAENIAAFLAGKDRNLVA